MGRVNMWIGLGVGVWLAGCSGSAGTAAGDANAADVTECAKACGVDADDILHDGDELVVCTNVPSAIACLSSCLGASVKDGCVP